MKREYYTVDQISSMISIHPKTIQRYIREGKLRATKIGKGWRVTGHDLSTFVESDGFRKPLPDEAPERIVTASSVIDIKVGGKDEAIRIMNTLTAALNSKPTEYGQSSMQAQYIEREDMVRVTLWGGTRFLAIMLDTLTALTEQSDKE